MGNNYMVRVGFAQSVPHSQFGDRSETPFLQSPQGDRPTQVRRRLSLTQAARAKPKLDRPETGPGHQKHGAWKHFHSTPRSIYDFSHSEARMPSRGKYC